MSDEKKSDRRSPANRPEEPIAGNLTPVQLLGLTALAIFVGEALIMLVMPLVEPMQVTLRAVLDSVSLTLIATPFLYYLLFRPMVRHLEDRRSAELALRELNESLEHRVAERTDELRRSNKALQREIHDRKATEERIRRTNVFIQRLLESAPCLVATLDVTTLKCNYVNGRLDDFLGVPTERMASAEESLVDAIVSAGSRDRVRRLIGELIDAPQGEISRFSSALVDREGRELPFRIGLVVSSRTAIGEAEEVLLVATPEDDPD